MRKRASKIKGKSKDIFIRLKSKRVAQAALGLVGLTIVAFITFGAAINWRASHCVGSQVRRGRIMRVESPYYSFDYATNQGADWHQHAMNPIDGVSGCSVNSNADYWLFRPAAAILLPSWLQMMLLERFPPPDYLPYATFSIRVHDTQANNLDDLKRAAIPSAELVRKIYGDKGEPYERTTSQGSINGHLALQVDVVANVQNIRQPLYGRSRTYQTINHGKQVDISWSVAGKSAEERDYFLQQYESTLNAIMDSVELK